MDVALVIERIEPWRGGAEMSTLQFAGHLSRMGCRVHMVTTTNIPSTPELTIVPIRANRVFRAIKTLIFAWRAARYVRSQDFDIVHCITPCEAADIYQPRGGTVPETLERNLAMRSGIVLQFLKRIGQGLSLKYRIIAYLERKLLTRQPPPWVIAISQYVSVQLRQHYSFGEARVRQVFNGVDPDLTDLADRARERSTLRKQFGLTDDDLVLLCVAHNFKLKGVAKVIEALAHRRSYQSETASLNQRTDHTYALIVGRDKPNAFAKLAGRLGVANRVLFTGPTQRISAFFHAADILVHPTFYDPCSRVVLEAMAAGLPVITTRFNGAAERITDGQEGYVIDSPKNVSALSDRIDRLADDNHRRACAACASKAIERVSMKAHAEQVLSLYEELLAGGDLKLGGYR